MVTGLKCLGRSCSVWKVILQLVLIVIPSTLSFWPIVVGVGVGAVQVPDIDVDNRNQNQNQNRQQLWTNRNQRASSQQQLPSAGYERDLVMETIETANYPCEVHVVTTKDGYILKLHRIPDPSQLQEESSDYENNSGQTQSETVLNDDDATTSQQNNNAHDDDKDNDIAPFRGVVLLMHGLFSTAADFVITGPESGLAFVLADAGYDVWMANARGSRFSRKNLHLTPKAAQFWDFSWHEIGTVDLPAIIDYILRHTGLRQIAYVGHNQGMTALLALLAAERPTSSRYGQKIATAIGMAPIAFLGGAGSNEIIQGLARFNDQLGLTLNTMNIYELTPSEAVLKFLGNVICSGSPTGAKDICTDLLVEVFGYSSEQARLMLPGLLENMLSGISTKQLLHYGQLMQSKKFQQYDYRNPITNAQRYKSTRVPEYDLSKIKIPFTLFYGTRDMFTSALDFKKLIQALPNVTAIHELPSWGHTDFIYNSQIFPLVYSKIIEHLKNFTLI
ncbi:lipase 3-like [Uranotaenia lowii]|uniref:lipase 3-like n=1 Tax=Uranotaenia lowii TaxID=190385 RepID=UPI0024793235|nr:lipase 3-like [Uranotaenia lowii]